MFWTVIAWMVFLLFAFLLAGGLILIACACIVAGMADREDEKNF